MLGEHRQRLEVVGLGPSQAKDSGEIFEIDIVLADEERKRRACQRALPDLPDEWVPINRLPDSIGLLA
jgi:hypothetical protein